MFGVHAKLFVVGENCSLPALVCMWTCCDCILNSVEDPYCLERNLHCVLGEPEEMQLREAASRWISSQNVWYCSRQVIHMQYVVSIGVLTVQGTNKQANIYICTYEKEYKIRFGTESPKI